MQHLNCERQRPCLYLSTKLLVIVSVYFAFLFLHVEKIHRLRYREGTTHIIHKFEFGAYTL